MLFEKPALDSRKLASQKGNNLILSNLDKEGNIVIPSVLCDFKYVCACILVCACNVCSCRIVRGPMRLFPSSTKVFESIILLFGTLFEIVGIPFSVEVPIGVFHMEDNNRN